MKYKSIKTDKTEIIINDGIFYFVFDGVDYITFFNTKSGKILKKMWEKLNKPVRRNDNEK